MNNIQDGLYAKLAYIGFRVGHNEKLPKNERPDIERTLVQACYHIDSDGRMLGLVFSWLKVHGDHLIADKFFKEYEAAQKYLGECPWFYAICAYRMFLKDHRFKKGVVKLKTPHHLGNRDQTSLINLKGSIDYLKKINIFVPQTALRIREEDCLKVSELIKSNEQYRNRFIWGANWRAEIIGLMKRGAKTPGEVAKALGLARSRVGVVFNEFKLAQKFLLLILFLSAHTVVLAKQMAITFDDLPGWGYINQTSAEGLTFLAPYILWRLFLRKKCYNQLK